MPRVTYVLKYTYVNKAGESLQEVLGFMKTPGNERNPMYMEYGECPDRKTVKQLIKTLVPDIKGVATHVHIAVYETTMHRGLAAQRQKARGGSLKKSTRRAHLHEFRLDEIWPELQHALQ